MTTERALGGYNPELSQSDNYLRSQLHTAIIHFYQQPLTEGSTAHYHTPEQIDREEERIWEVIYRNNRITELRKDPRFLSAQEREIRLRGKAKVGKTKCLDGRLPDVPPGDAISTLEIPAGVIDTTEKIDHSIRPTSPFLCVSLKDDAENGIELLELAVAHYDSTNPKHGCAANSIMVANIKAKNSEVVRGMLGYNEYAQIESIDPTRLEDANLTIHHFVTKPAITSFFNDIRQKNGYEPLSRIVIPVLFDTATMGLVLREEDGEFKTSDQVIDHSEDIAKETGLDFGLYAENFTNFEYLLDFYEAVVSIEEVLLDPEAKIGGDSNTFYEDCEEFIDAHYSDLTEDQKRGLMFALAQSAAVQYATGTAKIPEGGPNHPYSEHEELYMSLSHQSAVFGGKDIKQGFCSSAASPATGIEQIKTKWSVMDKNGVDTDKPRILFLSSTAHNPENRSVLHQDIGHNIALSSSVFADSELRDLIINNRLVLVHTLLSKDGAVIDILDHSSLH